MSSPHASQSQSCRICSAPYEHEDLIDPGKNAAEAQLCDTCYDRERRDGWVRIFMSLLGGTPPAH